MGNGFVHIELATDEVGRAKQFYKKVFDWKIADMPGMDYTTVDAGKGKTGGGMTKKGMPNQPTAWLPYVEVDSVKSTISKAAKAGAQVVLPFQAIGEMGAIGVFVDPTGAALGVWEAAKKPAAKKPAAKKPAAKKPTAKKTATKKTAARSKRA